MKKSLFDNKVRTAVIAVAITCMCFAAVIGLSACSSDQQSASTELPDAPTSEYRLDETAQLIIDQDNWDAFAANTITKVLGGSASSGSNASNSDDNECFSPISLYYAMALCAAGTQGDAQSQILELLGQSDLSELAAFCSAWLNQIQSVEPDELNAIPIDENYRLQLANSIWTNDSYALKQKYTSWVEQNLQASAFSVDFGTDSANQAVSDWISDETEGLLTPDFKTSSNMIATLINTVYFKDAWASPFEVSDTKSGNFIADSGTIKKDFMHKTFDDGFYAETPDYTAANLSFANGVSANFFLPSEGVDPKELLSDTEKVRELLNTEYEFKSVEMAMPKFTIRASYNNLADILKELGVQEIFDDDSGKAFEPMLDGTDSSFHVSDVVQESVINVDETGAEAAAYTAVDLRATALVPELEKVSFILDHPFVYMLESAEGVVLFAGIYEG